MNPPAPATGVAAAPAAGAQRAQLVDIQTNYALPKPQVFVRIRMLALDASALGQVSQPQIVFNPAFQAAIVHSAHVVRDGRRNERLSSARIEPMRREQRLEQRIIDGSTTLLVVLSDVRVGDAVEIAYTVEGENPIFEGRIATGMNLAMDVPVDLLHQRLTAPAQRVLQTKPLGLTSDVPLERLTERGQQVLRVVRHQVAAINAERGTPPWVMAYPRMSISEYGAWTEVDAWAQRLFVLPTPAAPAVTATAAAFRDQGLQGEALASEVLRFVQDEVRYFSIALGESSHRPKPPEHTLAERLGDCKDKVLLLNALLRELGFEAKPALVSLRHNRGIFDFLPSHDAFDHVITRLDLEGRTWYLDPTVNGQGLTLNRRGQFAYGAALVVGAGQALQPIAEPSAAIDRMEFEQLWDLARPGRPTQFEAVLRAHGQVAERWRAGYASVGLPSLAQAITGGFARLLPGLKALNEGSVADDRSTNRFEFRQRFEVPEFGTYNRGFLETDFLAVEMLDVLTGPSETQRRTPFLIDQPRQVDARITVKTPSTLNINPKPVEVVDRHFRYSVRLDVQAHLASFVYRYERLQEQVQPADLVAWREKVMQARQATGGRLRLPLINTQAVMPELDGIERRWRRASGGRSDALQGLLIRNDFNRLIDTKALESVTAGSALAAKVLTSRAIANNLLGDSAAAQADAQQALVAKPDDISALEALAVALFYQARAEEALQVLARISPQERPAALWSWMGAIQMYLNRPAQAEASLREAIARGSGDERTYALIWLYLAVERQDGRGQAAIEAHIDSTDATQFAGAVLRYLGGRLDRAALLRQASEKPEMERLNLAEARFYIGQHLLAQGQRQEALRWFERTVDINAVPYREHGFAKLELQREGR